MTNDGYNPAQINEIRQQALSEGRSFVYNETEPRSAEYAHFYFVGNFKGQEVIYDAIIYTLELHHGAMLYEMAEEETLKKFPDYKKWDLTEDADGNFTLPEEEDLDEEAETYKQMTLEELEEEEVVKVAEKIEIDESFDFGVGVEVCINVEEINDETISAFVASFNAGTFIPDPTMVAFHYNDDEDEDEDEE
jgi:hypothetical protein